MTVDTRAKQLSFFDGSYVIKQDQELLDYIRINQFTSALTIGSTQWLTNVINTVDQGPVSLCIWIQNSQFKFNQLVQDLNAVIENHLHIGSVIYLAVNKYLADPDRYDHDLDQDYDIAIAQYIGRHVRAKIEQYRPCGLDRGDKFNWVHPLTRFYLRV